MAFTPGATSKAPLLAAVQMERAVLNILLFLIIAVAGFGILAIFFMIVVEKTRDIGILKSLGPPAAASWASSSATACRWASSAREWAWRSGCCLCSTSIKSATCWSGITGQPVFDPSIYYFYKIPTIVDPFTVAWIVVGALSIAVLASILPALRAARLHPVEALRYE